jgi:hypothetical protein
MLCMSEDRYNNIADARSAQVVKRPALCPFCKGTIIDTLAKVFTVTTFWRCLECEQTWTIASQRASSTRCR